MDRVLEHSFANADSFYNAVGDSMDVVYGLAMTWHLTLVCGCLLPTIAIHQAQAR